LIETLRQLSKKYELMVMSASSKELTNKIVDFLERDGDLFSFRLYREACYMTDTSLFIKDLRIINRPLDRIAIVDDSTYAFGFQLENGVPIIPYTGDPEDNELILLSQYLDHIALSKDFRQLNRDFFRFHMYADCSSVEEVYKKIFKD
jgi:CTD small phosphatase-like protein 2